MLSSLPAINPAPAPATLCVAAMLENRRSSRTRSGRTKRRGDPLLARALAIALRLIRIDLAHFLQEILGIRSRNIRCFRAAAAVVASLFRSPRHRRFLHAIRHGKNLGTIPEKANRAVEGGALATVKARCQHDYDENPGDSGVGRISPCRWHGRKRLTRNLIPRNWKRSAKSWMSKTPRSTRSRSKFSSFRSKCRNQACRSENQHRLRLPPRRQKRRAPPGTHTPLSGAKLSPPSPSRYKVGVEVLQRFNHIENDRKLQIGQTIMIPNPATATVTPTPTPTPEQSPAPNN